LLVLLLAGCRTAPTDASRGANELDLGHGIALIRQGELDGGIDLLRAELQGTVGDSASRSEAHRWIGHARTLRGDPEGALEEYRAALELAPSDAWLHYACGVSWNEMGELELAVACFTHALELDPRHVKSLQWRGESCANLGDWCAAVGDYGRAVECIESADEETLASWGETRRTLLIRTLELRADALEALGEREAAARDRGRASKLVGGG